MQAVVEIKKEYHYVNAIAELVSTIMGSGVSFCRHDDRRN
jgi:hypothetical protein